MSKRSRDRQRERSAASTQDTALRPSATEDTPPVRGALAWLIAAFLLPNLGTVGGSFLYDDLPIIVQNERLHSLAGLAETWTHGYWPDRPGLTLFRPVTQTVWTLVWTASGGSAVAFHALNLALGLAVTWLVYQLLVELRAGTRTAFWAALLFAVLPIHTEVNAAIVGSNELLAAAFGLGAWLLYLRHRWMAALLLYALAVFSKESAAALAGLAVLDGFLGVERRPGKLRATLTLAAAGAVVSLALWARNAVAEGPVFIPPVDNPMALVGPLPRLLTALWTQVLYLAKTVAPVTLSADYSYKEIPLVMGLGDPRAWAGLAMVLAVAICWARVPWSRLGLAWWIVPFLPAANLLMPIGTMMGERLAFLPSLGVCLLAVQFGRRLPRHDVALVALVLIFAVRTHVRNGDWRNADAFYPKLVETAPGSAKAHYFLGCYLHARDQPAAAVAAYDRAVGIFPAYPEAFNNRGCALVELGRLPEAIESFSQCLRFNPGHAGAAASLAALAQGVTFKPGKPRI